DKVNWFGVLDQEAACADTNGLENVLVQIEGGEDDDLDLGKPLVRDDAPCSLQAVAVGHSDVHEHYVRDKTRDKPHRLVPIDGLPHDLHVVLGIQQRPESSPYKRLIVSEQDSDHAPAPGIVKRLPSSGSRANPRNPPSERGPASTTPPRAVARS